MFLKMNCVNSVPLTSSVIAKISIFFLESLLVSQTDRTQTQATGWANVMLDRGLYNITKQVEQTQGYIIGSFDKPKQI